MNGAALLAHQLRVVHQVVAQNLEGMSAEDALLQPPGGGNCANWILGHLVNVHNELARVLGVEAVWEDPGLPGQGPSPSRTRTTPSTGRSSRPALPQARSGSPGRLRPSPRRTSPQ